MKNYDNYIHVLVNNKKNVNNYFQNGDQIILIWSDKDLDLYVKASMF